MRALAVWLVTLGLMMSPAVVEARADSGKETAAAKKPDGKTETVNKIGATNKEEPPKASSSLELELQQLKDLIRAQSQELAAQREALREQETRTEVLLKQLAAMQPATPGQPAGRAAAPTADVASSATGLTKEASRAGNELAQEKKEKKEDEPASLRIKGITLTPGGFFDASTVWRQRGLVADVNTPFNSIPFPGSSQAHLSEFNASGRATRITMLAEGKIASAALTGFYEADFLGAATTSNNNQSNSYAFRQRQAWGQASLVNGWTFTGGQMWSLVTERKKGVENRTEAVTMTIDHQYNVGFSWARQYGFRVTKDFGHKAWLAVAVEGAQTTLTAHGNANNFLIAAPGVGGGLFNNQANYSFNTIPDFIVKAAFEPHWGHYEIFGVVGLVRSRVFPCATASVTSPCSVNGTTAPSGVGAFNDRRVSGGFGANIRVPTFHKKVDLGLHFFGGDGIGRYGTGGLPVATVRPDGTLSLLHSYQGLGTVELHPGSKLDIYINWGGEYASRAAYKNALGGDVGYGSPLFSNAGCNTEILPANQNNPQGPNSCTGDTRALFEGTLGFWYRFYKGSKGTVQWGPQYSYIVRTTWSGVGGQPRATENMVLTSFRYYVP